MGIPVGARRAAAKQPCATRPEGARHTFRSSDSPAACSAARTHASFFAIGPSTSRQSAWATRDLHSSGKLAISTQVGGVPRSEEHTSELQSLMRISYAVFCLKKKIKKPQPDINKKNKTNTTSTAQKY